MEKTKTNCTACDMEPEGHPRKDFHTCETYKGKITHRFTTMWPDGKQEHRIVEESQLAEPEKDLLIGCVIKEYLDLPEELKERFKTWLNKQ